jgi:hypothetical protein
VGKSQLAAAYAHSVADEVDVLVWVSATNRAAILSTYSQASIQLAAVCGVQRDGAGSSPAEQVGCDGQLDRGCGPAGTGGGAEAPALPGGAVGEHHTEVAVRAALRTDIAGDGGKPPLLVATPAALIGAAGHRSRSRLRGRCGRAGQRAYRREQRQARGADRSSTDPPRHRLSSSPDLYATGAGLRQQTSTTHPQ